MKLGKSTLVKLFCKSQNIQLIEINLDKIKIRALESEDFNLDDVLEEIELIKKLEISRTPNLNMKQILFLDEIQEQKSAFKALRYFYEEMPNLAVIAAGSLLEFLINNEEVSIPVGRLEYLKLGPMSFEEFIEALGENSI